MSRMYCYNNNCPYFIQKGYVYGHIHMNMNLPDKDGSYRIVKAPTKCPHCQKKMTRVMNETEY